MCQVVFNSNKFTIRYLTFLLMGSVLILASCSPSYKKAKEGYEYKIIKSGTGKKLEYGQFLEFHLKRFYINGKKDTLLGDSREYMPQVQAFDSLTVPPVYLDMLSNTRKGDSIVLRIATDSAYPQFISLMPRHFKSGGYIYTTIKILNIFETRDQADSANLAEFKIHGPDIYNKNLVKFEKQIEKDSAQIASDSKIISAYLDKRKIKYTRGKWGTFIVVHEEGTGKKIAYNDVVAVNYLGKTLDSGRVFDSNTDPKFEHMGTYEVTMSKLESVIPGWTDALLQLREGSKATIYIPSSLAYGKKGKGSRIKPNENVIFDIDVKVVITEFRAMEIVSENKRRAETARQKLDDSLKKAQVLH